MQWVLWQGGFKNRVEGRELANHLLVGCIKHYQLYLLSTGFLNHQPQYNCAAYWATKEGGKKRIWNQLNSHEISSFLLPCFYCSRIMYISIVSSDISDTMDINVFEISSSQGTGPPLFSPTWKLRHLLSLWTLHDALPPFQFSPCKSQKVGSCWGHQSRFQQRYFNFEIWPKVTHLKKKTIYRGYQLSPHFFWTKTRKDRWYFLGVFFARFAWIFVFFVWIPDLFNVLHFAMTTCQDTLNMTCQRCAGWIVIC